MVPSPLGKSGVAGKGLMSISVKKDTKFPNASIALAQFFTNPRSMVEFAKQVAIYPSSPSAYDDPFFSTPPTAIEDSARPLAKDIVATYQDIVPTVPNKADVNDIVRKAVESALFNKVAAAGRPSTRPSPTRTSSSSRLTGSATRSPGSHPIAGPSHPGRASLVTAPVADRTRHHARDTP